MPQTPTYSLRYPAPSDTPDVPRDLEWLAADVEFALANLGPTTSQTIPVVTTLPPAPADGDKVILTNSTRAYAWLCQYDATAPAPHRWLVLHAAELAAITAAGVSVPGDNVYATAVGGPVLALPRPGVWLVELGCDWVVPSGSGRMGVQGPGSWPAADDESAAYSGASSGEGSFEAALPAKTITIGGNVTALYKSTNLGVNCNASKRWLQARPVRIS
jgi:hypothetical protein